MRRGTTQALGRGPRVVIQEIDQLSVSGVDGRIALHRRLPAARDDHLKTGARIIKGADRFKSRKTAFPRPRRNYDCHRWQAIAHCAAQARVQGAQWKLKTDL